MILKELLNAGTNTTDKNVEDMKGFPLILSSISIITKFVKHYIVLKRSLKKG